MKSSFDRGNSVRVSYLSWLTSWLIELQVVIQLLVKGQEFFVMEIMKLSNSGSSIFFIVTNIAINIFISWVV